MDPAALAGCGSGERLPRTRGDGPATRYPRSQDGQASPHTRGWTLAGTPPAGWPTGFPAHAGMDHDAISDALEGTRLPRTRGDGPLVGGTAGKVIGASPHTRGWTPCADQPGCQRLGFPAHAGMDRRRRGRCWACNRLPRTRGDGPCHADQAATLRRASPHTRGWTLFDHVLRRLVEGFPAHAGMDPCRA